MPWSSNYSVPAEAEAILARLGTFGLCAVSEVPTSVFYPRTGENQLTAKRICGQCELKQECLDYAIRFRETHGIWGGLNERERSKYRKRLAHTVQAN